MTFFKNGNLRISFAYFEIIYLTNLYLVELFRTRLSEQEIYHKGTRVAITATIGLCTGESIADYEEYLRQADEKLYWGKKHGKNQIVK